MGTRIEWADETWNPVVGCSRTSLGCVNCYAARMARRLKAMGIEKYREVADAYGWTGRVQYDAGDVRPVHWMKPRRVFVCSEADLFGPWVPPRIVSAVMQVARGCRQHTFMFLTKHSGRMLDAVTWAPVLPAHFWLGVTVEHNDYICRIDDVVRTGASVAYASFEPLLGPIDVSAVRYLDWVIVGCETGPGRRPMELGWAREIVRAARRGGKPVFVKALEIDGKVVKDISQFPADLRYREIPKGWGMPHE